MPHVLTMLECDPRLLFSLIARGYTCNVRLHFPMLAYVHILRCLAKMPVGRKVPQAMACTGQELRGARRRAEAGRRHIRRRSSARGSSCRPWDFACGEEPLDEAGPTKEAPRIVTDHAEQDGTARPRGAKAPVGGGGLGQPAMSVSMDHGYEDIMGLQGSLDLHFGGHSEAPPLALTNVTRAKFGTRLTGSCLRCLPRCIYTQ